MMMYVCDGNDDALFHDEEDEIAIRSGLIFGLKNKVDIWVMGILIHFARDGGAAEVSIERLAELCNVSVNRIVKSILRLSAEGIVSTEFGLNKSVLWAMAREAQEAFQNCEIPYEPMRECEDVSQVNGD